MFTFITIVAVAIAGFVGGLLVGRKNKSIVEKELKLVKDLAIKAGVKL